MDDIIGLASDHAGFALKQYVKTYLDSRGMKYHDFGTYTDESCDYPDYGHALGRAIDEGSIHRGIALCGSGIGISITLNKHSKVRAALCWIPEIAQLCRRHNDANVLVLPGRFIDETMAKDILDAYFATAFEGGRHARRVAKIPL